MGYLNNKNLTNFISCEYSGLLNYELQTPRGSQIRYEEDELYEEMKDTCRQHSQLTAWYCPSCPLILAGLKVIKN